jgi:hypothetical protein
MSEDVRDAARRALAAGGATPPGHDATGLGRGAGAEAGGARVVRAVFDIEVDGRTELVSVTLRDGELLVTSSGEPQGAFVDAALRMLAGEGLGAVESHSVTATGRTTPGGLDAPRSSIPPSAPTEKARPLADLLDDVITAVVRVGVRQAPRAPAVTEAIERLPEVVAGSAGGANAASGMPPGLARWFGMLKGALAAEDVERVAWLLDGASQLADILREGREDSLSRRYRIAWLGPESLAQQAPRTRLSDKVLVEIGREYLPGLGPRSIERRYLASLDTGEIFREERSGGSGLLSVGPCPRVISVGLADVQDGVPPRPIRLLQYAISPELTAEQHVALNDVASRSFGAMFESYRDARSRYSGISEPTVLVAPLDVEEGDSPEELALLDAESIPLPLARAADTAAVKALHEFIGSGVPSWVAGRLIDTGGTVLLVPISAAIDDGSGTRMLRLS